MFRNAGETMFPPRSPFFLGNLRFPSPPPSGCAGQKPGSAGYRPTASKSAVAALARCECSAFQSLPSSATVCVSPIGTNTGS